MSRLVLGIDFGTGGCKATAVDEHGKIAAAAGVEYPSVHLRGNWSEQDPDMWIDALIKAIHSILEHKEIAASDIEVIAVTASTHNAVLLDENDNVLRRCIMWNDQRSDGQARQLKKAHGEEIFKISMQYSSATWTMPQLLWIKENEPDCYAKVRRILFTKDYVRNFITGGFFTDPTDAQGSMLFDAKRGCWSSRLCELIGLDPAVLPPVLGSTQIAGRVGRRASKLTGLIEGVPVITGCSDTAAEDFGAGATQNGQLILKLATAGNVTVITDMAVPHPMGYCYPYVIEDMWYLIMATNAAASSFRWLRDAMYRGDLERLGKKDEIYRLMDENAAEIPVGSCGVIFHPYIFGERCPHFSSAVMSNFFGVTGVHDIRHFTRAVLEGVGYSLFECMQIMREVCGDVSDIKVLGGGSKSDLWCGIISDIFGVNVSVPKESDSSFGGALLAGIGAGIFDTASASRIASRVAKTYHPNRDNHEKYLDYFETYREISRALMPVWERLAEQRGERL